MLAGPLQKSKYTIANQTTWLAGISTRDNAALPLDPGYTQYRLFARTFKPFTADSIVPATDIMDNPLAANEEGVVTYKHLASGPKWPDYAITVLSYPRVPTLADGVRKVDAYAVVTPEQSFLDAKRMPSLGADYDDVWAFSRYYVESADGTVGNITADEVAQLGDGSKLVAEYIANSKNGTDPSIVYRLHLTTYWEQPAYRLNEGSAPWSQAPDVATYAPARYYLSDWNSWSKGVSTDDVIGSNNRIPLDPGYTTATLVRRVFYPDGSAFADGRASSGVDVLSNPLYANARGHVDSYYRVDGAGKASYTVVVTSQVV